MTYEEYNKKYKAELLKESPVTYLYTRAPGQYSESKSMNSYGSINNGVRYINVLSNEQDHLLFFIPLALKLGSHDWVKSDAKGINVEFHASDSYPGFEGVWSGEWGNFTIEDDDYRNFRGSFTVYKKAAGDQSPPSLTEGTSWVKFLSQG